MINFVGFEESLYDALVTFYNVGYPCDSGGDLEHFTGLKQRYEEDLSSHEICMTSGCYCRGSCMFCEGKYIDDDNRVREFCGFED